MIRGGAGNGGAGLEKGGDEAVEEECGENDAVEEGEPVVGFDQPVVVDDATKRGNVDEAVEGLPTLAAKTTDPACSGSERKRNQKNKRGETNGDEGAFGDVFQHAGEIERLVRSNIGEEVQADVGESEETEHAAEADEVRKIEDFAQRGDGESDEQEAEGPIASEVLEEFDGIGAELAVVSASGEEAERRQAGEEDHELGPFGGEDLAEGFAHVSSIS